MTFVYPPEGRTYSSVPRVGPLTTLKYVMPPMSSVKDMGMRYDFESTAMVTEESSAVNKEA